MNLYFIMMKHYAIILIRHSIRTHSKEYFNRTPALRLIEAYQFRNTSQEAYISAWNINCSKSRFQDTQRHICELTGTDGLNSYTVII